MAFRDSHIPPGPTFLSSLEAQFAGNSPDVLRRAQANLERVRGLLGLSSEEWNLFRRGTLAYDLLFVEPLLELAGSPIRPLNEIAEAQLLALLHWRSIDALMDADNLQLNPNRHRELAFSASARIRDLANASSIDWDGAAGDDYESFYHPSPTVPVSATAPGAEIVSAFLQEQYILEPKGRMSFLFFVPEHLLRASVSELVWYRFYVSTLSLDDDIDDILADAIAGRETPAARFLKRLGAFSSGQSRSFHRYLNFLAVYLLRQLGMSIELAKRDDRASALLVLRTIEEAVKCKNNSQH